MRRKLIRPRRLRRRWQARAVCVTLGSRGAVLATQSLGCAHIPVPGGTGPGRTDACGAGDRFAIAATLALAAGDDAQAAVAAAVRAASRFVAAGGAVGVSTGASMERNPSATTKSEAITGDIATVRDHLRRRGGTLVATGGCFDLLHTGHVRLLRQARQLGDCTGGAAQLGRFRTGVEGPGTAGDGRRGPGAGAGRPGLCRRGRDLRRAIRPSAHWRSCGPTSGSRAATTPRPTCPKPMWSAVTAARWCCCLPWPAIRHPI